MPTLTAERTEVFSQAEAAKVLKVSRQFLAGYAAGTKFTYRSHPVRYGRLHYRSDIEKIAEDLGVIPDWDAVAR